MGTLVIGATGVAGRAIAAELDAAGEELILVGRDVGRLATVAAGLRNVRATRVGDLTEGPPDVRGADVVVSAVGPYLVHGEAVVAAVRAAGAAYVDVAAEPAYLRRLFDDPGSVRAPQLPASGGFGLVGDVLAALAAREIDRPRQLHVAWLFRGPSAAASRGVRESLVGLPYPQALAFEGGELTGEVPAERRRLAWFPRPVGPRAAVGWPGPEPVTVPRHVPGLEIVRSYLALPGAVAEAIQAVSGLARRAWVRDRLERWARRGPTEVGADRRAEVRWACVAEAVDASGDVAHAWAYGTDPYRLGAATVLAAVRRIRSGDLEPRVHAPAEVHDPVDVLDTLADRCGLRWSVRSERVRA